jgi:hypothetical protein
VSQCLRGEIRFFAPLRLRGKILPTGQKPLIYSNSTR